jgi:hypothetical protein
MVEDHTTGSDKPSKVDHVDHHGDTYRDEQRKGVQKVLELKR